MDSLSALRSNLVNELDNQDFSKLDLSFLTLAEKTSSVADDAFDAVDDLWADLAAIKTLKAEAELENEIGLQIFNQGTKIEAQGAEIEALGAEVEGLGIEIEALGVEVEGLGIEIEGQGVEVEIVGTELQTESLELGVEASKKKKKATNIKNVSQEKESHLNGTHVSLGVNSQKNTLNTQLDVAQGQREGVATTKMRDWEDIESRDVYVLDRGGVRPLGPEGFRAYDSLKRKDFIKLDRDRGVAYVMRRGPYAEDESIVIGGMSYRIEVMNKDQAEELFDFCSIQKILWDSQDKLEKEELKAETTEKKEEHSSHLSQGHPPGNEESAELAKVQSQTRGKRKGINHDPVLELAVARQRRKERLRDIERDEERLELEKERNHRLTAKVQIDKNEVVSELVIENLRKLDLDKHNSPKNLSHQHRIIVFPKKQMA